MDKRISIEEAKRMVDAAPDRASRARRTDPAPDPGGVPHRQGTMAQARRVVLDLVRDVPMDRAARDHVVKSALYAYRRSPGRLEELEDIVQDQIVLWLQDRRLMNAGTQRRRLIDDRTRERTGVSLEDLLSE